MKGTPQARQDLERLLHKLIAGYSPQRVFLFGSHAYGEPDQHSDLDLLIVKETNKTPFQRRVEVGRIVQEDLKRTHDLEVLLNDAMSRNDRFQRYLDTCIFVREFYVEERYPFIESPSPARREFEAAVDTIREMVALILEETG
jgi:predicted nucleotidyltransferase